MKILTKLLLVLLFSTVASLNAQFSEQITERNTELDVLRKEIKSLESELSKLSEEEKLNLSVLKKIDKQNLLLGRSIKNLEKEEIDKENQIVSIEQKISALQTKIKSLQERFGDYLVWLYKQGDNSTLKYIFNAESFNQAMIRYKHLEYIHSENEETIEILRKTKKEFDALVNKLAVEVEDKVRIINQKSEEKKNLLASINSRRKILNELKKDKDNVAVEIDEKRKMEIAIKQIIADLIEKERERERKLRTEKLKGNIDSYESLFNYDSFENFAELKGVMNWPVQDAKVERGFGENRNRKTNTVTLNYGIDFITDGSKNVYSVAEGIVSAIEWIPGYGSVVIITHRDNYRTVYGHLTEINVLESNKVVAGDLIGKVNESLEGNILHFEIWNERNYQNPQEWLVKK